MSRNDVINFKTTRLSVVSDSTISIEMLFDGMSVDTYSIKGDSIVKTLTVKGWNDPIL